MNEQLPLFTGIQLPTVLLRQIPEAPPPSTNFDHRRVKLTDLSNELLLFLVKRRINPQFLNIILFYAHPHSSTSIHKDIVPSGGWTINAVLGPAKIKMKWFSAEAEGEAKNADLLYIKYDESVCTLIDETELSTTLCRIDIPHQGENADDVGSWMLSLRVDAKYLPWEEVKRLLS